MNVYTVERKRPAQAVQYVRMSTDMQKYSTENQIAAIAVYASRHDVNIVKTYLDAGKSGLTIKSRPGLQQLINDVRSARPGFDMILVYDVSRWGRFQDADESAYYEFICREAGISVRYCAEEFENDGSLGATIIKAIKRAMAAEYSRELSNRVFAGKCRMTMRGFHAGGRAAYGLRRMLVDERGLAKSLLQDGERKFLHTDRTILVPGPSREVETVRWIFDQYVNQKVPIASIVCGLNARGIPNATGKRWQKVAVHTVLANEKYIGNSVFNRSSIRLKSKRVNISQGQWIRAKGAFEAIIEEPVFLAAQARLTCNLHRFNKFELLDHLTAVWCKHGKLSSWQLDHAPMCPGHTTFRRVFGSVLEAFDAVGYRYCSRRPVYASIERAVAETIIAEVIAAGGIAERVGRRRRQNGVLVEDTLTVSIHLMHGSGRNYRGRPRWKIPKGVRNASDLTILAPYDKERRRILTYYLVPGFLLAHPRPLLFDVNPIEIDAFRSNTVQTLIHLIRRASSTSPTKAAHSPFFPPLQVLCFKARKGASGLAPLLRGFEKRSRRVVAFVERCENFIRSEYAGRRDLDCLLNDRDFRSLLRDEQLDALPMLAHDSPRDASMEGPQCDKLEQHCQVVSRIAEIRELLKHVRPERLRQIQQLQAALADFSPTFAKLLIAASKSDEFQLDTARRSILTRSEAEYVLEIFRPVEERARAIIPIFAQQAYQHASTRAYIRKLRGNERVTGYIRAVQPRIYRRLIAVPLEPEQSELLYVSTKKKEQGPRTKREIGKRQNTTF
jgi:DNA invertase Pin-like site-specific DNA recombinase